jgi:outer membrane biosynthesis protein TonB
VSVVLQVLGATYSRLRAKLTSKIGQQKVARLEKTFDFLRTIVTGGLAAAWQKISEFAGNLQEMVIGGIKEWVMRSVITAAITKLISMFNPAGVIVQAAMAIYNTVMFFIERGSQIAALAQAVFNSIGKIAAGNVAGAANYVEQTMGRSLPVIISFLARLIGLGGVSDQIKNVIKKIQDRIDNALNKLANFIVQKGANRGDRSSNSQPVKPNTVGRNNQKPAPNNRQNPQPVKPNNVGRNNQKPAPNNRQNPQPVKPNNVGRNNQRPVPNNRQNPQPVKPNTVGQNNQRPVPNNRSERQQQQQAKLDHDRKVKKGLAEIQAEEKKIIKGRIRKQEAQSIAAKVKRSNPIFKSITVIDGGDTWDYKWVASEGTEKGTITKEEWLNIGKEAFPNKIFTLK